MRFEKSNIESELVNKVVFEGGEEHTIEIASWVSFQ